MRRVIGLWVVVAVMASACGGGAGGVDPSLPGDQAGGGAGAAVGTQGPEDLGDPSDGADSTLPSPLDEGASADGIPDLCDLASKPHSFLVEIGLLREQDLADLPVPFDFETEGYWNVGPLGPDGAAAVGAGMVGDEWLCDLEPTPGLAEAIGRLVDELGDDVTIEDIIEVIDDNSDDSEVGHNDGTSGTDASGENGSAQAGRSDRETEQYMRDLMHALGIGEKLGLHLGSDDVKAELDDVVDDYYGVKIFDTGDPAELLDIIAILELLGHDELAELARDRVEEILRKELADAEALFTPCTTDEHVVEAYFRALSRAHAILDVDTGLASEWIENQARMKEQVANGEDPSIPECEGAIWTSSTPLPSRGDGAKWEGTIDIVLTTCGFKTWKGTMTVDGVLDTGDGTMTQHAEAPLNFTEGSYGSQRTDVLDTLAVRIQDFFTLAAGDAQGEGLAEMDALAELIFYNGEYSVKITYNPADFVFVITADGVRVSTNRQIDWGAQTFRGELQRVDELCDATD